MSTHHGTPPQFHYIFVDYENVTNIDSSIFGAKSVHLTVILGANQTKLDTDLVQKLLVHPTRTKLITLTKTGKNALDFVLAYEVGRKAAANPSAFFHVISKDKGFDGLLTHLKNRKISAKRHDDFSSLVLSTPVQTPGSSSATIPKGGAVTVSTLQERLKKASLNRPKSKKTLLNFLKSHLGKESTGDDALRMFNSLLQSKNITIGENNQLTYSL